MSVSRSELMLKQIKSAALGGNVAEGRTISPSPGLEEPRLAIGTLRELSSDIDRFLPIWMEQVACLETPKKQRNLVSQFAGIVAKLGKRHPNYIGFLAMHQDSHRFSERVPMGQKTTQWLQPDFSTGSPDCRSVRAEILDSRLLIPVRDLNPAYHSDKVSEKLGVMNATLNSRRVSQNGQEIIQEVRSFLANPHDVFDLTVIKQQGTPAASHYLDDVGPMSGSTPWFTLFLIDGAAKADEEIEIGYCGFAFSQARSEMLRFGFCPRVSFESILDTSEVTKNLLIDAVGKPHGYENCPSKFELN